MSEVTKRAALAAASLAVLGLGSRIAQAQTAPSPAPRTAAPPPAAGANSNTLQRSDPDMRRVLEKLQQLGAQPIGSQSVDATRRGPTPADAVKAVLRDDGKDPAQIMAQLRVRTQDARYPTGGGEQPVRIYIPEAPASGPGGGAPRAGAARQPSALPVIVYYHGGGWVIADIATYEASAMALASKTGAIVVSAEYRHAPENKFPAAHEDAFNAYRWVLQNAAQWGGDPRRVAVAGESAGGNLALNVAIMARDNQVQRPAHMLLVYPVAGVDMNTPSYQRNAEAIPLGKAGMMWFVQNALNGDADLRNPMIDLVGRANLRNLPAATVITAEIDPLMSEGRTLADKLRQAGSAVEYAHYEGVAHEFFGMAPVVRDAERAQTLAARELREAFATVVSGGAQPARRQ